MNLELLNLLNRINILQAPITEPTFDRDIVTCFLNPKIKYESLTDEPATVAATAGLSQNVQKFDHPHCGAG